MIKNKRGGLSDMFIFMVVGFILALCCGIFVYIGSETYTQLLNNAGAFDNALGGAGNGTQIIQDTFGAVPNAYNSLKWITSMLLFGMVLSIMVTSFLVRTRPVFFVAYILIYIIAIVVSVPISNVYEVVYQTPTLATAFSGFYGQTYIFLNLPMWIALIGGLAGILMYIGMVKQSAGGGFE